mmetsp:Transcript_38790/g.89751  ORF Transcript_38790/g.89751 Transcript_38790/m.89751 type:complete len:575 (-) Transcript_38790:166-1890(-)
MGVVLLRGLMLGAAALLGARAAAMPSLVRLPVRGVARVATHLAARQAHLARLHTPAMSAAAAPAASAEAAAAARVPFPAAGGDEGEGAMRYGDHETVMSQAAGCREYAELGAMLAPGGAQVGERVWIRARVAKVRGKGNSCFLVLRQGVFHTLQACYFKDKEDPDASKAFIKWLGGLSPESIVDVQGTLKEATVNSTSIKSVELSIERVFAISRSEPQLPFQLDDAVRTEEEIVASEATDRPWTRVPPDQRLDHRWIDLRTAPSGSVLRVRSAVCQLFREALYARGFTEIQTPKLIGGESEGGAAVFTTDYFDERTACLAQSPQLYKQAAICGDMQRVFEIGPVFRKEKSHTRRHLCEFTGLDMEMEIKHHYNEALEVVHATLSHIFNGLESRFPHELAAVRSQYPSSPARISERPTIVHWEEGMAMLKAAGVEVDETADLTTAIERSLGELVADKYGVDLYILDRFPTGARPFYTMPCADNPGLTNSYDIFLRGEEICSGAQRVHVPEMLEARIKAQGLPLESLQWYVDAMKYGTPPHAGAGLGLDRVVFLYLALDNVRKATMFPRDPNRLTP